MIIKRAAKHFLQKTKSYLDQRQQWEQSKDHEQEYKTGSIQNCGTIMK